MNRTQINYPPNPDFSGKWTLVLTVGSTKYQHEYNLTQIGDVITGTGKFPAGNYDENVVGQVVQFTRQGAKPLITLTIVYLSGDEGYGGCAVLMPTSNSSITGQYIDVNGTQGSVVMTKVAS